ncbi:MAG TPA: hypothetical protein VF620_04900 [Allosphingosinicella sp.]|jgi:hypothetical protein
MGAKTFRNQTSFPLTLQLFVRKGDNPASLLNVQSLMLAPGQSQNYNYSDNANPYLNGMGVQTNGGADALSAFQYVIQRGSPVDNLYNQNSVVSISVAGQSLTVQSSNA